MTQPSDRHPFNLCVSGFLFALLFLTAAASAAFGQAPSSTPAPNTVPSTAFPQSAAKAAYDEGFALLNKGTAESHRAAVERFKEAIRLYHESGDQRGESLALFGAGYILGRLGDEQEALKYYNQALLLERAVGDRGDEAAMLNNIGQIYDDLGEKQEALKYFNQALPLCRAVGDRSGEATTLNNIGRVYDDLGEKQEALRYYDQVLPLSRSVSDRRMEATTVGNIGAVYGDLGEKQEALKYLNQALPLYRAMGDRSGEATTLNNIGRVYDDLGKKQEALKYFNQALPLSRSVGDRGGEATTLNNIGLVYAHLGEKQEALKYYNQALPLSRAVGDRGGEATTLDNIGVVYNALGEKQEALKYYNQALPLRRAVGDRGGEATTLNNIGGVYDDLGEKQEALKYFNQALPLLRAVGDRGGEATTLNNIGGIYDDLGEKQEALKYYNLALPLRRAVGDRSGEAATLSNTMVLWNGLNNRSFAIFYGKQSINAYQQLRANIDKLDRSIQQTYLKTVESSYRYLAELLIQDGLAAEAEQVNRLLKEEEYFHYLQVDGTAAPKEAASTTGLPLNATEAEATAAYERYAGEVTRIGAELAKLEPKLKAAGLGGTVHPQDQAQYDLLNGQMTAARSAFTNFLEGLKAKFGNTDARVASVESDLQGSLKALGQPRAAVISVIAGEDTLSLILTTSGSQSGYTVPLKAAELERLVTEFRAALTNPARDPRPAGQKLYGYFFPALLQKNLDAIQADTIIWSLDGPLRYVPMAALSPDGQGYLAERYTSAVLTLASRDKLNGEQFDRAKWQVLGVGVAQGGQVREADGATQNFGRLDAVPEELCGIVNDPAKRQFCAPWRANGPGLIGGLILPDGEFTLTRFQTLMRQAPVVHIASHFSLRPGGYAASYLLLGGNQTFSLAQLQNGERIEVDLLTLSACNTAASGGALGNGVEVENFGALAQNKGAHTVVATLWSVADPSTRDAMIEFYRQLETHREVGKAEALRRAQLALLRGTLPAASASGETVHPVDPGRRDTVDAAGDEPPTASHAPAFTPDPKRPYAHPYYWAPFVLYGNWR